MGGIKVNQPAVFVNEIANRSGHHWLNVRLTGTAANRPGIGARVTVVAGGVTRIREIRCGSGLGNHQDPPEAHFGLGTATVVDRLVVRWPDPKLTEQTFTKIPVDRFVSIIQGRGKPGLEPPGK
jgi:hypothetical protein